MRQQKDRKNAKKNFEKTSKNFKSKCWQRQYQGTQIRFQSWVDESVKNVDKSVEKSVEKGIKRSVNKNVEKTSKKVKLKCQ